VVAYIDFDQKKDVRARSQVPPPEVVAWFCGRMPRKTRKHVSAFTSQYAPLAEPVVSERHVMNSAYHKSPLERVGKVSE
jgi:hypothetical protein